jgi:hypothetical protein
MPTSPSVGLDAGTSDGDLLLMHIMSSLPSITQESDREESEVTLFFNSLIKWLAVGLACVFIGGPLVFYTAIYAPFLLLGALTGFSFFLQKNIR